MAIKAKYTVKDGDTTSRIALNYSVTVQQIITANPQVYTADRPKDGSLIFPGDILNIPSGFVDELKLTQIIKAESEDELNILINNKRCPLPHTFELTEIFDSCSDSFQFTYPFDPNLKNPAFQINIDDFKTKGLPDINIQIGNDAVLTGSIEVPSYKVTPSAVIQTLGGRSATFLLEKSDILPSIEKEHLNLTLLDLASIVANSYSISVEVQNGIQASEPFPKVTIEDNEKPFFFISRLARERALILGKTGQGKLLIHKAQNSTPVANFKIEVVGGTIGVTTGGSFTGFVGVTELEFTFDTKEIYGTYQGKTSTPDDQSLTSTVQSSFLTQQSIKITDYTDAEENTLPDITAWEEQKAIREFYKNAIPFPSWLNPNTGKRWKTGQLVTLESLDANIKSKIMLIRMIQFTKDEFDKRMAVLGLIPVGVYL